MIALRLTEYRGDGNFYPLLVLPQPGMAVFEAELKPAGPHIVGETKPLGKGALISGLRLGANIVVKETVEQIQEKIASSEFVSACVKGSAAKT